MNTKTKALLAFTFIFLIGFASGYVFNQAFQTDEPAVTETRPDRGEHRERDGDRDRSERERRAREWLTDYLDLEENQQGEFFEKMNDYRNDIREVIRNQRSHEHDLIIEQYYDFRSEISSLLNSDQLEKLDSHFHPDSVKQKMQREPQREQRRGRN